METCSCVKCKRLFSYYKKYPFCNSCDDQIFGKIKEYLKEHEGANAYQLSIDTEIPLQTIIMYIRDQRLQEYLKDACVCIVCGKLIEKKQKYCPRCLELIKSLNEIDNRKNEEINFEKLNSSGFHSSLTRKK